MAGEKDSASATEASDVTFFGLSVSASNTVGQTSRYSEY